MVARHADKHASKTIQHTRKKYVFKIKKQEKEAGSGSAGEALPTQARQPELDSAKPRKKLVWCKYRNPSTEEGNRGDPGAH